MSKLADAAESLRIEQERAGDEEARIASACAAGAAGCVGDLVAEEAARERRLARAEERYWAAFMEAARPRVLARPAGVAQED